VAPGPARWLAAVASAAAVEATRRTSSVVPKGGGECISTTLVVGRPFELAPAPAPAPSLCACVIFCDRSDTCSRLMGLASFWSRALSGRTISERGLGVDIGLASDSS